MRKKIPLLSCKLLFAAFCIFISLVPAEAITILSMGDSITRGGGFPIGAINYPTYRYYLYTMLTNAGVTVDYVGPHNGVGSNFSFTQPNPAPYTIPLPYQETGYPDFPDQDLAGSTGWKINEFLPGSSREGAQPANLLMNNYNPDYVLVHLGTNDLGSRLDTPQTTINKMSQLIDRIRVGSSTTKIYIAQIIPLLDDAYGGGPGEYQLVQAYNALLPSLISDKNLNGSFPQITLVDMWTGFDPLTMLAEKTHPNNVGDKEMAKRWYNSLAPDLNLTPIPEPATFILCGSGLIGMILCRRRKK